MNWRERVENNVILFILGFLVTGFISGITAYEFLQQVTDQQPLITFAGEPDIESVIESSDIPMYFADNEEFKIRYCNEAFLSFYRLEKSAVIGKTIWDFVEHLSQFVPKNERNHFMDEQLKLQKLAKDTKLPHAEAFMVIDNRDSPVTRYRHFYDVWIHIDKVYAKNEPIGIFGIIRPVAISRTN
ncbi:MAG: hypothetical protein B6245_18505 [Desulfobacteraceae bacterium 4572_88]|nr:MAG: hypothetical protein B6245_18505 [Desulfobacteraceae bacterium 4572_88]RLC17817.1 MAG: hypothetical protein DRI57_09315 [Deltaproteobacteria bacterium]